MNNPIMYANPSVHMPEWLSTTLKIIGEVASIAGCIVDSIFTCGALSVVLVGATIGATAGGIGALCGCIGQSGWMQRQTTSAFVAFASKNTLKHLVGMVLLRMTLPAFILGGVVGGIYGRLSSHFNPNENFVGI